MDRQTDITPIYTSIQYIQCSPVVEEEEESSRPCVEFEIHKELLLYPYQFMPLLEIGFERFEENIWKI